MKKFLVLIICFILFGCSSQDVSEYANNQLIFNMKSFFQGNLKAEGIVKGINGKVVRTFTADLTAKWSGDTLTLDEQFLFNDGGKQSRTWIIKQVSENSYTGTASDIVGQAKGESAGNALNWKYSIVLNVDNTQIEVDFDDWINNTGASRPYFVE